MKKLFYIVVITISTIISIVSCKKEIKSTQDNNTAKKITTTLCPTKPSTIIPIKDASIIAQNFLQSKNRKSNVYITSIEIISKNNNSYFYIANSKDNKGYVLLSTDSLYPPLLAYDTIGNFDNTNLNLGLILWMNKHGNQMDFIRTTNNNYTDSIVKVNKELWKSFGQKYGINIPSNNTGHKVELPGPVVTGEGADLTYINVGPLCQTVWNQASPYNLYCPPNPVGYPYSGHDAAGCVPIAMAQVMYFWKNPSIYKWNIMLPAITVFPVYNQPGYLEDSRLVHDIGISKVNWNGSPILTQFVSYGPTSSSAPSSYIPDVFEDFNYYGVASSTSVATQIFTGAKNGLSYTGLLLNEISIYNRPCIISGYSAIHSIFDLVSWPNNKDGHTWVCDGVNEMLIQDYLQYTQYGLNGQIISVYKLYQDQPHPIMGYLHMNWGWGGVDQNGNILTNNGWYNYSINYTQPSSSSPNYQYFQTVFYNIHK